MSSTFRSLALPFALPLSLAAALPAQASIALGSSAVYTQSFDSLATSGSANVWANDGTLAGWSLFIASGAAAPTYAADTGSSNAGAFKSYGASGSSDRALGGLGSGGTYFGSPAAGAVAGWIAVAFTNTSGSAFSGFTLAFDGEQWRDGGATTPAAQTMVLQYGFGSSFASVTSWSTPGGSFNFTSPVFTNTASGAAVDGNTAGKVAGLGGTIDTRWDAGQTLWVRWVENNDFGNDHGLAIDNLSFNATTSAVPEPGIASLLLAGLLGIGFVARRR